MNEFQNDSPMINHCIDFIFIYGWITFGFFYISMFSDKVSDLFMKNKKKKKHIYQITKKNKALFFGNKRRSIGKKRENWKCLIDHVISIYVVVHNIQYLCKHVSIFQLNISAIWFSFSVCIIWMPKKKDQIKHG